MSGLQGGPTPRRSTRLSSATPSVAGQSVAASTATGVRRKAGALPKAKARQSQGYGAGSRIKAAEELTVPTTGFSQAFDKQRDGAVGRDDEHGEPIVEETGLSEIHAQQPRVASSYDVHRWQSQTSRVQYHDYESSPTPSNIDDSKSYGALRETGLLFGQTARPNGVHVTHQEHVQETVRQPVRQPAQEPVHAFVNEPEADIEPARPSLWHQYAPESVIQFFDTYGFSALQSALWSAVFVVISAFVLISINSKTYSYVPSMDGANVTGNATQVTSWVDVISSRLTYHNDRLKDLVKPPVPVQSPEPLFEDLPVGSIPLCEHPSLECDEKGMPKFQFEILTERMFRIEAEHKRTQLEHARISTEFKGFRDAIRRYEDHLPDKFTVTRNKDGQFEIPDEFWQAISSRILSDNAHSTPQWEDFSKKNEARVEELLKSKTTQHFKVVAKEEMAVLMEEHYLKHEKRIDNNFAELKKALSHEIKVIAKEEARVASMDQLRLASLAVTNLVANAELNLKKVNYFSPGLGARINHHATSATNVQTRLLSTLYRNLMRVRPHHTPSTALERWDEPGDCWCAAVDSATKTGRAQLSVMLSHPIYPTQVTIEHIPKEALPRDHVATAPKAVEVWVNSEQPLGDDRGLCLGDGPKGYTCLGTVEYNIDGANHVQTFWLDRMSPVPVTQVVVRVVTNWGGDHTCLYRVRLHGDSPGFETKE